jgi:hypothetical protein
LNKYTIKKGSLKWKESKHLKQEIYVTALKTADAENARLHASQLAKLAVE